MPGSKAPTKAPSAGEWIRGGLLAWPDEGQRLRGEQGANKGAVSPGKNWACWRDRMKKQGFAGSKAPTRAPSAGEKAARVGVGGRRNKASPGARRQHRRRQFGKNRPVLACPDEETRLCEERCANMPCRATLIHAAFGKAEEIRFRRRKFCLDYIQIRDINVKEILD